VDHAMITKPIKEGVNSLIKNLVEKQLAKKKLNVTYIIIFNFVLLLKILSKRWLQDHGLAIMKNHSMPL